MERHARRRTTPMFLYELAIESGMRSHDLVELAAHVGLGEVSPSTALTRAQADTLLAAARTGGGTGPAQPDQPPGDPSPSGPGVWSGPLPPPPASTPATGQPPSRPGVWSSSLPPPPASSHVGAPPPGMPALDAPPPPAGWGPPPPAPSSYGAPLTAGPDGAAPAPPVASLIGSPTVGPLASWLPPSPRADGPGEGFPPPPKTKSARSQMVIVVVAALAAVALLGYMAMNIGPDEGQKREAAAAQRRADAATPTTFTAPPTTNTTTTPSATTGPDSNTFADPGRFCRGIRFTSAFFLRVVAGTSSVTGRDKRWRPPTADRRGTVPWKTCWPGRRPAFVPTSSSTETSMCRSSTASPPATRQATWPLRDERSTWLGFAACTRASSQAWAGPVPDDAASPRCSVQVRAW